MTSVNVGSIGLVGWLVATYSPGSGVWGCTYVQPVGYSRGKKEGSFELYGLLRSEVGGDAGGGWCIATRFFFFFFEIL